MSEEVVKSSHSEEGIWECRCERSKGLSQVQIWAVRIPGRKESRGNGSRGNVLGKLREQ